MPEHAKRPHPPRHFSSHLRQHHTHGKSRRNARLSRTPSANYGTMTESPVEVDGQADFPLLESQSSHADSDGLYPPGACWTADTIRPPDPFNNSRWPVYHNIHMIRREIINSIDDPYGLDQLKSPRMNLSVVRPLVDQFYKSGDLSMVYCLLVNRTQFMRDQRTALHHQTVNLTRALLCELVAEKVLRRYNEANPGPKGLLKLANILVAGFEPFQNAPDEVVQNNHHVLHYVRQNAGKIEKRLTALEIAIVSESKSFLASSGCQKVVDAIYRGKLVYTPNSFIDILPDSWKRRPISLYDPARGPLLNQYRLVVPRTRNAIEVGQFCVLLVLYLLVMEGRENRSTTKFTLLEGVFDVYALGWILDQIASMLEHGWQVYTQNLWSFLDVAFSGLFMVYFVGRMRGLTGSDKETSIQWARTSLDALSCAAPVLIPRLAFNIMSENLVFLCLRSMLADFANLLLLVIWCFVGFLLSLKWLHNGIHEPVTIGKWMIWIWFGLDGTGIQRSPDFHWLLGPAIMISFAFLGNTLFVTILVSMLSNTFSRIADNATQEMHFRRAVLTFQGVKSDSLFAYQPPFNLLALLILWPLKWTLSPRWFHKVNVATVKVIGAPLLIIISFYERRYLWLSHRAARYKQRKIDWTDAGGPREQDSSWWARTFKFWDLSQFSAHRDMQAVFDEAPPESATSDESDDERPKHRHRGIGRTLREDLAFQFANPFAEAKRARTFPVSLQESKLSAHQDQPRRSVTEDFDTDGHHDADSESDRPLGYKKPNKRERLDSLIDLDEDGSGLHEANVRLHKLEDSMMKIEKMLLQMLSSDDPTNEEADAQEDLAEDISPDEEA